MSSIISKVKVSRSEPVPLHDQVAAEIRRSIAAGEGGPGERLPPAKDLAAELGVNSNTVLRLCDFSVTKACSSSVVVVGDRDRYPPAGWSLNVPGIW